MSWGEAKFAVVDQFVRSPSEAEALAQATLDELASAFVEAEGTCQASPDLMPGKQVQIEGVGKRFNGTYYVTQVIHTWNKDEGLTTHFVVSGRQDRGVGSLLEETRSRPLGTGQVIGIVTAILNPTDQRFFVGIGFAVPIENAAAAAGVRRRTARRTSRRLSPSTAPGCSSG